MSSGVYIAASTAPAWVSAGVAAVALALSVRHELILRRPVSVHVVVREDDHTNELELHVWVTSNRPIAVEDVRLYFNHPTVRPRRARSVEDGPGPHFRSPQTEDRRVVDERPLEFTLPLRDYREYCEGRNGKAKYGKYVAIRTADGKRYKKRVPRKLRTAAAA